MRGTERLSRGPALSSDRFSDFVTLTHSEEGELRKLLRDPVSIGRRQLIRSEGAPVDYLYLLVEGWAASSMILRNGARQFFKIHLPGDVMGAPSLASQLAVETLSTLSDCLVRAIPVARLGDVFTKHPRLGASLFLSANKERVALMDILASVAQLSSAERVGRFLLDLYDRLASLGLAANGQLTLVTTQEEIGDLLGLTSVHVNRTFQDLKSQGLLSGHGRQLELDIDRLRAASRLPDRCFVHEPAWLPPANDL